MTTIALDGWQVCVVDCQAKCCRSASTVLALEQADLVNFEGARVRDSVVLQSPDGPKVASRAETGRWYLVLADVGGVCPNLQPDYSCGIYDRRPHACREWPTEPTSGCALSGDVSGTWQQPLTGWPVRETGNA